MTTVPTQHDPRRGNPVGVPPRFRENPRFAPAKSHLLSESVSK